MDTSAQSKLANLLLSSLGSVLVGFFLGSGAELSVDWRPRTCPPAESRDFLSRATRVALFATHCMPCYCAFGVSLYFEVIKFTGIYIETSKAPGELLHLPSISILHAQCNSESCSGLHVRVCMISS